MVRNIYLYDNYLLPEEQLQAWASERPAVTYIDWGEFHPYSIQGTQVRAYQHAIDHFESDWQINFDMDEYPFAPDDTDPGFLLRVLETLQQQFPAASEFSCKNLVFLGKPSQADHVMERMLRRTPQPMNALDKPIFRPQLVASQVHHNRLRQGSSVDVDPRVLRMNHYWGARLQQWGEDTTELLERTVFDDSAVPIVRKLSLFSP